MKIKFFRDAVKEIHFKGTARDPTGRFLQLIASQLTGLTGIWNIPSSLYQGDHSYDGKNI